MSYVDSSGMPGHQEAHNTDNLLSFPDVNTELVSECEHKECSCTKKCTVLEVPHEAISNRTLCHEVQAADHSSNKGHISRPSSFSDSRSSNGSAEDPERLKKMCDAVRTLLECVGEDPNREGLQATPLRYAKALLFLTKGYKEDVNHITNGAFFHEENAGMVIVRDIEIYSLCEHHLVPFTGKMHVAYVPSNTVIGLSKLPRIAEMFSRRLQIQERLTNEVARAIHQILNPRGVAVVVESRHLCMVMRGVQKSNSVTVTSCFLGCFETDAERRREFLGFTGAK